MRRTLPLILVIGVAFSATAALAQVHSDGVASGAAPGPAASNPDPWEGTNRKLYKLNKGLDRAVIRPSATFYHHALTHPIREGVHNVIYNLGEPVTFINNVLQARPGKAVNTAVRFATNTTVGVLGIFDVTGGAGMAREPTGFADTLNRYGAPQGPYIYLPVFGPSSVRDLTGRIVDVVSDPFTWVSYDGQAAVQTSRGVAGGLDRRVALDEALKDIDHTATDPYATTRSAFLQASSVTGETETDVKALPDFGPEPAPSKPAPKPRPKP